MIVQDGKHVVAKQRGDRFVIVDKKSEEPVDSCDSRVAVPHLVAAWDERFENWRKKNGHAEQLSLTSWSFQ